MSTEGLDSLMKHSPAGDLLPPDAASKRPASMASRLLYDTQDCSSRLPRWTGLWLSETMALSGVLILTGSRTVFPYVLGVVCRDRNTLVLFREVTDDLQDSDK